MGLEDGFLRAIIANPADDVHRLVFADWLEEHGQPERAEFIRVQVELARAGLDEDRRLRCWAREQELLSANREPWVAPLRPWAREYQFRRGFVEIVRVRGADVVAEGRQVFARTPVRAARFNEATEHVAALAAMPELSRLRALDLGYNVLRDEHVKALADSPNLTGLHALDLACNPFGDAAARALAEAPRPHLRELRLYRTGIGPAGLQALLEAQGWHGFTVLVLNYTRLHALGARLLAESPRSASLAELDLSYSMRNSAGSDVAVEALARSPHLGSLRVLRMAGCRLSDGAAAALASAVSLHALEELDLTNNGIGDAGALALARSVSLSRLRRLGLGTNNVSDTPRVRRELRERFGEGLTISEGPRSLGRELGLTPPA